MAISQQDILDAVANMTVMEIVDLISAMEEKFGVSAAAAVAVAAPAAAAWRLDRLFGCDRCRRQLFDHLAGGQ